VITTTPSFYPINLCNEPAQPMYDWFMLLVTILIEMMPKKHEWAKELCEAKRNVVTFPRVVQALKNAVDSVEVNEQLKSMLIEIATRAELPVDVTRK